MEEIVLTDDDRSYFKIAFEFCCNPWHGSRVVQIKDDCVCPPTLEFQVILKIKFQNKGKIDEDTLFS